MYFQWSCSYPFPVLIITSVLGNLADVDFRIEVRSKCFMVITGITIHDVQILDFIEIVLCSVSSVYTTYSRVETTT